MNSATTFDASTGVIDFSVTVAGKAIPCRVTEGWLRKTYGPAALDDGALKAFTARRATVDAAALANLARLARRRTGLAEARPGLAPAAIGARAPSRIALTRRRASPRPCRLRHTAVVQAEATR